MGKMTEKIIKMNYMNQSGRWPTGCESVSAVMVLNHLGIDISVDEFIEKYIPCRPFECVNGVTYGADPYVAFAEVLTMKMLLAAMRRLLYRLLNVFLKIMKKAFRQWM